MYLSRKCQAPLETTPLPAVIRPPLATSVTALKVAGPIADKEYIASLKSKLGLLAIALLATVARVVAKSCPAITAVPPITLA